MLTLADLLIALKNQLWIAIEQEDRDTLSRLANCFGLLMEIYKQNEKLYDMLDDLGYTAAEAAMGMPYTSDIPSDEKINAICRLDDQ